MDQGWKHLEKERYEQAIAELEEAKSLTSKSCKRCVRGIALANFRLKRYEEALLAYEELFEMVPGESIKLLERLVRLYDRVGTPEKSVAAYKSFLEHSDKTDEMIRAANELGYRLLTPSTGVPTHRGDAEHAFRLALDLAEGKANVPRKNLAEALWRLNRKDEALDLLADIAPPDEEPWKDLRLVEISRPLEDKEIEIRKTWDLQLADRPLDVGGDVKPPIKIHAPQPQYTEVDRKARVQGTVIVQALIDEEGNTYVLKVLNGVSDGLNEEAIKAIQKWKFEPATLNGVPVRVYYNLSVRFRLQ